MNVKKELQKAVDKSKEKIKVSECQAILNYIQSLESEVRRLAKAKGLDIEIPIEE